MCWVVVDINFLAKLKIKLIKLINLTTVNCTETTNNFYLI